ncbi:hypothetical protein PT283_10060, partial [Acetobacteraceae bacterium ESL0697]|nr:hypothetical protein [Acetobacteraceae bacterium ESL0697]
NELHDTNPKKDVTDSTTNKILGWVASGVKTGLEGASYLPIIGDPVSLVLAGIDAAQGDYKGAALNLAAAGVGLYTWGMGKDILVGGAKGGKFLSEAVGDAVQKPNVTITDTTGKIGDNATSHEAVGEGKNTSANGNKGENGGSASGAEATNLDGKNPNTGKVGDNCATDECVTVHGKRPDKPTANSSSSFNQEYLDEMSKNGVKFSPDNLVKVEKLSDGRIVFLETGNSKAGLQHIVDEHGKEFAQMGVPESEIPNTIMDTLKNGKIVGYQGEGTGRPIYETVINGKKRRLAITVGNNGFIVGANSKGSIK